MTKKLVFALLTATGLGAVAQESAPADSALSLDVSLGYSTHYVWRGLTFNNSGVLQGDVSTSYDAGDAGSFSAGVWGNLDLSDEQYEEGNFTEVDIYAGWEKSFDMLTIGAGVIKYHFPQETGSGSFDTTEVYVSAGLDVILSPSVTVYYDVEEADGDSIYVSTAIGHDFDLDFTTLSLGAAIGYTNGDGGNFLYGEGAGSGFTDAALSASVSFDLTESISVSPFVSWTTLLEDAKDANGNTDEVFGGVNFSMSF